jgi:hypothetical protein
LQSGDILQILLDDGEPIENVPGSIKGQGRIGNKKPQWVNIEVFVELQGVEPWSKQETNMLSTCLVDYWFSNQGWKSTSDLDLSPLSFARESGRSPN